MIFLQFLVYFTSKVGKLKAIHIICKRDIESAKVAPESELSIRGESRRYALDQEGYLRGGVISRGLSPYTTIARHGHVTHTTFYAVIIFVTAAHGNNTPPFRW